MVYWSASVGRLRARMKLPCASVAFGAGKYLVRARLARRELRAWGTVLFAKG